MDSRREKAIAFAADTSKLLISLSTGFVAFTVTFLDKVGGVLTRGDFGTYSLLGAWALFSASVACGVWTQLALTQELEPKPGTLAASREPSIRSASVKRGFQFQLVLFGLAIVLAAAFGGWRMFHPVLPDARPEVIIRG